MAGLEEQTAIVAACLDAGITTFDTTPDAAPAFGACKALGWENLAFRPLCAAGNSTG